MTPDGHYVAFTSDASNLVSGDTNGRSDVFVRDLVAGTTVLVSAKSDGTPALFDARSPSISADGRRVAFVSGARLVPADVDSLEDVYIRDLQSGTTMLASRQTGAAGAPADQDSSSPALSADGAHVAFVTAATNLAPSLIDPNGIADVYMRDLGSDVTKLVSSGNGAVHAGTGFALAPSISADGTRVAFESRTPSLAPGDANGALSDVYVRDLAAGTTWLASRNTGGVGADVAAGSASISADGTRVAMLSAADNLADGAPAGGVFVRDLAASTTTLASRADGSTGAAATRVGGLALSPDGHCVAFDSTDDHLVAGMPAGTDFFHVLLRGVDAGCPPAVAVDGPGADGVVPAAPPAPAPTPVPTPAPAADRTAPVLSALKLSRARFRVAAASTAKVAAARTSTRAGTQITFRVSEAARVALVVQRVTTGARRGTTCVKATKLLRRKPRCALLVTAGTLTRSAAAGSVRVAFSGRLGRRALRPGRYRLRAVATDAAGNRSTAKTVTFTVVRR